MFLPAGSSRACLSPGCASLSIRKTPHLGILSWSGRLDAALWPYLSLNEVRTNARKSSEVQIVLCAVRQSADDLSSMESGHARPVWQETWTWALIFSGTGVWKYAITRSTSFCMTLCFGLLWSLDSANELLPVAGRLQATDCHLTSMLGKRWNFSQLPEG